MATVICNGLESYAALKALRSRIAEQYKRPLTAAPKKETSMRILIAEDDQVLADGLLRTLRSSGAAVDHVASGTEADAALMTNTEFDLLILDLGLPKMHGLEVRKKRLARCSSLPALKV